MYGAILEHQLLFTAGVATVKHLRHNTSSRLNDLDQPSGRDFDDHQWKKKHSNKGFKVERLLLLKGSKRICVLCRSSIGSQVPSLPHLLT